MEYTSTEPGTDRPGSHEPVDPGVDPRSILVDRAAEAAIVLTRHASETEQDGRPNAASLAAVSDLGAFALAVPRELGGLGGSLATTGRVLMELGAGCPSTSWVTGTANTAKRLAMLGTGAEALADPDAMSCGSGAPNGTAVPAPGGARMSGRWPIVSGCEDAKTAVLAVMRTEDEDDPPTYSVMQVPRSNLLIERTWDSAGLRGTGSHTVIAQDVFVPSASVADVTPTGGFVISGSVDILAPLIGAAQGALALTAQMLASGRDAPSRTAESPGVHQLMIQATELVDGARARLLDVCGDIDEPGDRSPMTAIAVSTARVELATAAQHIRRAIDTLLDVHGSGGFARTNPMQRFWRDISVGTRHPLIKPSAVFEQHAALLSAGATAA